MNRTHLNRKVKFSGGWDSLVSSEGLVLAVAVTFSSQDDLVGHLASDDVAGSLHSTDAAGAEKIRKLPSDLTTSGYL